MTLWLKRLARAVVPSSLLLRRRVFLARKNGERELFFVELACDKSAAAIDVGANLGVYTYVASKHAAHVYAIEPVPQTARMLARSVPTNVTVLSCAASDENAWREIYVPETRGSVVHTRASLDKSANPGFLLRAIEIETKSLDQFDFQNVGFLKIDVEGHEHAVLAGAQILLTRCHPSILIETEERHHQGAVALTNGFLKQFGYQGYFLDSESDRLCTIESFNLNRHQRPEDVKEVGGRINRGYINNFLFVHPERNQVLHAILNRFPLVEPM